MKNFLREIKLFRWACIKVSLICSMDTWLWKVNPIFVRRILVRLYFLLTLPKYIRYLVPNSLYIPELGVTVTKRCTLRCRDCSAMVPYYGSDGKHPFPWEISASDALKSIHKLLDAVDGVVRFGIQGGETFLYSDLAHLVDELKLSPKIKKIHLVTNGTMIPDQSLVSCLRDPKVYIRISDYGRLSFKKQELIDFCIKNKISYRILPMTNQAWMDSGPPLKRGRSAGELQELYKACYAGIFGSMIVRDMMYVCCRAAALIDTDSKPAEEGDGVALDDSPENIRKNVKALIMREIVPPSCDYCDSVFGEKIEAAIQTSSIRDVKINDDF